MSPFVAQPAVRRRLPALAVAGLGAAALLAAPVAAQAKTYKATVNDPAGDGTLSSADILTANAKYTPSTGSLRVTMKTAAALNLRKKNQLVFMFTGKDCAKDLFGATALMDDATAPWAYSLRKQGGGIVNGSGTVSKTTYIATFHGSKLTKFKPLGFQVALFSPGVSGAVMDQTDCVDLK